MHVDLTVNVSACALASDCKPIERTKVLLFLPALESATEVDDAFLLHEFG